MIPPYRGYRKESKGGIQMSRVTAYARYEQNVFLLCSLEIQLRAALLCPDKTRERSRNHLPL